MKLEIKKIPRKTEGFFYLIERLTVEVRSRQTV